ncbi:MAG: sigma-70 family RNA polymerase sigma factor [Planctomycetes bacterium]|nr:sigma-70 family RNA polymerase sigma factor [Planctomycetota bacterium]
MEDLELVRGLRERREEAVRVYLERYRTLFQHCIGNFEQDPTARDDLFQDLTWHALERLRQDSFDPARGSFGTWLYRVAWCRCVDLKRQENARRRVRLAAQGEELPEEVDPGAFPADAAGEREIGAAVRSALAGLEGEDRALLELRIVDERTLIEIAAELAITVEQAKYRFKRAMAALRKELLARMPRQELAE